MQLDEVLQNLTQSFKEFWTDLKDDTSSALAAFVAEGLEKLTADDLSMPPSVGGGGGHSGHGGGVTTCVEIKFTAPLS